MSERSQGGTEVEQKDAGGAVSRAMTEDGGQNADAGARFATSASVMPAVATDGPGQQSTFDQAVSKSSDTGAGETRGTPNEAASIAPRSIAAAELAPIQTELIRLKLLQEEQRGSKLDHATTDALIEAFGGDEWRRLSGAEIIARLRAATPPQRNAEDHFADAPDGARPRYGKMFADGVLDVTIGFGHDDTDLNYATVAQTFTGLGLERDDKTGAALLAGVGKRPASGPLFVARGAIPFKPPAGAQRHIDLVVRLVLPNGNDGPASASAFLDGMKTSDATFYGGHGNYGTGPDFDAGALFNLRKDDGSWRAIDDVSDLKWALRGGIEEFERRIAEGSLVVNPRAAGNVLFNDKSPHSGQVEGQIHNWLIEHNGTKPVTGADGALADPGSDNYRLLAMTGCRTEDYRKGIRGTPGYDARQTDMFDVDGYAPLGNDLRLATAFLVGLMTQSTANELQRSLRRAHGGDDIIRADGFEDNPRDHRREGAN